MIERAEREQREDGEGDTARTTAREGQRKDIVRRAAQGHYEKGRARSTSRGGQWRKDGGRRTVDTCAN